MRLPKRLKEQVIIAMAHIPLPFYMLAEINRFNWCLEAYCDMFQAICKYDCFSIGDMEKLLKESKQHMSVVKWNIDYVQENFGSSDKLEYAKKHYGIQ